MSDQNTSNRQLNAIVGAALRELIESGASDEDVGSFATRYRGRVAQYLDESSSPLKPPDLTEIVAQAVAAALKQVGFAKRQRQGAQTQRLNVELGGRRTSISIQKDVIGRMTQKMGSFTEVRKFVQQVASASPKDAENRSSWVEERIESYLAYLQGEEKTEVGSPSQH